MKGDEDYTKKIAQYGTTEISEGSLTGTTDTDYFYFLCPNCEGGGSHIMRILDYYKVDEQPFKYVELRPKGQCDFIMAFELYCPKCKLRNLVKIMSGGRQGGKISDFPV